MLKLYFLAIATVISFQLSAQHTFKRTLKLMGSKFDITVVAKDSSLAAQYIQMAVDEISRIEKLISEWDEHSQTSEINRQAGIRPVVADPELFNLIERSLAISKLTDGAFDISYASMDKIWRFDGSMQQMPSNDEIKNAVSQVGYQHIILDSKKHSVFLENQGMKIGFGAIGKGYAADMAKSLLIRHGVEAGIVNASGDMNTWGRQPDGKEWTVAITNPMDKQHAFALLPITNGAVVTSGNYEKFVTFNGIRYTHIINPKTGYPTSGIISATVFAPKAELADALATSIFVMGVDAGIHLVEQIPQVECIIIDEKGGIHTSSNIKIEAK